MLPKLYKIDSKKKIREWEVVIDDYGDYVEINVIHGEQNGKKQSKITTITEGKNIGKANETSILDQAIAEAQSKFNKQLDKGYSLTGEKVFRPMLAHDYKKYPNKVIFPCIVQPKLDGFRTTISLENGKAVARSRRGKEWKTVKHILKEVEQFLLDNPSIILDGELFTTKISFQKICSAIKRDESNDLTNLVEFHCYDLFNKDVPNYSFEERYALIPEECNHFIHVPTNKVHSIESVKASHKLNIMNGYEGTIIRNSGSLYKVDGRSHDLLKYKDFLDREYLIVDKNLDKNEECVFVCLDENLGKTFGCKPKGTHEERQALFYEDNINQYLTVRFFEYTTDGLPRFPVGQCVRID